MNINVILEDINRIYTKKKYINLILNIPEKSNVKISLPVKSDNEYIIIDPYNLIDLKETVKPAKNSDDLFLGDAENYLYYVWRNGKKHIEILNKSYNVIFVTEKNIDCIVDLYNRIINECNNLEMEPLNVYAIFAYSNEKSGNGTIDKLYNENESIYNKPIIFWYLPIKKSYVDIGIIDMIYKTLNKTPMVFNATLPESNNIKNSLDLICNTCFPEKPLEIPEKPLSSFKSFKIPKQTETTKQQVELQQAPPSSNNTLFIIPDINKTAIIVDPFNLVDVKEIIRPNKDNSDDLYLGDAENYLYYVWRNGRKHIQILNKFDLVVFITEKNSDAIIDLYNKIIDACYNLEMNPLRINVIFAFDNEKSSKGTNEKPYGEEISINNNGILIVYLPFKRNNMNNDIINFVYSRLRIKPIIFTTALSESQNIKNSLDLICNQCH